MPCQASISRVFSLPTYSLGLWPWRVIGHFHYMLRSPLAASFHTPSLTRLASALLSLSCGNCLRRSCVLWSLLWPQGYPHPHTNCGPLAPSVLNVCLCPLLDSWEWVLCLSFLSSTRESGTCRCSGCVSVKNKVMVKKLIFMILVRSMGQLAWLKLREMKGFAPDSLVNKCQS